MTAISDLENYKCTLFDTRDQLKRFIFDRSDEAFTRGDETRDRLRDIAQVAERAAEMREKLIASFGGLPSSDSPLNSRVTGVVVRPGFRIEKVIFESRPGHYVTSNLYIPEGMTAPGAAVLFLCGHEREAKHGEYYQRVCQTIALAGLVVFAIDPIGQGERLSYSRSGDSKPAIGWGTHEHEHAGIQCLPLGHGLARYFLHDAMRAVDYLCTREEVDPLRIGVTGHSGGGTQTSLLMICDERIAAAAPGTFIMNRQMYMHAGGVQDSEQVWPGLSGLGFDHEDILICFAPKPLQVLAVQYDFFPIEATRRTVGRCRKFWEMHGKSDDLLLTEDVSLHRYTDRLAEAAAAFFRKHLLGLEQVSPDNNLLNPLPPEELWCTRTGYVREELDDSTIVMDENILKADELTFKRASASNEHRREKALSWLHSRVMDPRSPHDLNPRIVPVGVTDGLHVEYVMWWSQSGIMNSAFVLRGEAPSEDYVWPVSLAVWEGGTTRIGRHWDWVKQTCESGKAVFVLNVSGVGPHAPYPIFDKPSLAFFGVMHKLADDLLWLGDSLAALRTYDVIRCLDLIGLSDVRKYGQIEGYAAGRYGIYLELAGALDGRIREIRTSNGLDSVTNWVKSLDYDEDDVMGLILPGMLGHFDLSDLREWRE